MTPPGGSRFGGAVSGSVHRAPVGQLRDERRRLHPTPCGLAARRHVRQHVAPLLTARRDESSRSATVASTGGSPRSRPSLQSRVSDVVASQVCYPRKKTEPFV